MLLAALFCGIASSVGPPLPMESGAGASSIDGAGEPRGCAVSCVAGDIDEGEPSCLDGYVDAYNGGCNSVPVVYNEIECGQTVCGTYGTYLAASGRDARDTDFYRFTLPATSDISWTIVGEARTRVFIFSGTCPARSLGSATGAPCESIVVSLANVPAGTYFAFVATEAFSGVACGSRYRATLELDICGCRPDYNNDGRLNSQDFFEFMSSFFGGRLAADFDGDGAVNSMDFFSYVNLFFAGC